MSTSQSRTALASLPRSLKLSKQTPINRTHLLALYKEQLKVAHSFTSYNFKQYFVRRTRDKFRNELPSLLDGHYSSSGSRSATTTLTNSSGRSTNERQQTRHEADDASIYTPTTTTTTGTTTTTSQETLSQEERLRQWYAESLSELAVMARSAIVNRMYEAPRLVVEGVGRIMTAGGGGAGAEARFSSFLSKVAPVVHKYTGPTLPTAIQASRSLATMTSKETAIFANGW
ncbi:hypothetical protein OIO90_000423 [Microbotryomycetes sp. JL221]|nr:hypothetical protein OIO90_000423 [Microbotryomycetes sp. JL221]